LYLIDSNNHNVSRRGLTSLSPRHSAGPPRIRPPRVDGAVCPLLRLQAGFHILTAVPGLLVQPCASAHGLFSRTRRRGYPKRLKGLVLFDIDGTLLRRAGPHHRDALVKAVRRVAGVATSTDGVPVAGMLDRDILTAMLQREGVSLASIHRKMPEIVAAAQAIYVRRCPDLRRKVCPGARMLLYRLSRQGIPAGLVTGNLTRIGWRKMEQAGLRKYLQFGAFAESARDRAGLVRLALRHARRNRWIDRTSPIALIGDHPNDIRAAKANRVRSVAVATGIISAEELREHSPDILVEDLRSLTIEMLLG